MINVCWANTIVTAFKFQLSQRIIITTTATNTVRTTKTTTKASKEQLQLVENNKSCAGSAEVRADAIVFAVESAARAHTRRMRNLYLIVEPSNLRACQ